MGANSLRASNGSVSTKGAKHVNRCVWRDPRQSRVQVWLSLGAFDFGNLNTTPFDTHGPGG